MTAFYKYKGIQYAVSNDLQVNQVMPEGYWEEVRDEKTKKTVLAKHRKHEREIAKTANS